MQFTIPRTKTEMYNTLKSIYSHYRLNSVNYSMEQRQPLELEELTFNALSNGQLLTKAETIVEPSIIREKQQRKDKLNEKIDNLLEKKNKIEEDYAKIFSIVEDDYEKTKENIRKEAVKKGLTYSSLTTEKMYQAENDKTNLLAKYENEKITKQTEIDAEISAVRSEINGLDSFYNDLLTKDINKKFEELKDDQDKISREVFKYNNSLNNNLVRYHNSSLATGATLEMKYLEIRSKGFSKEALVDMGYYADVINCVCGYYDSLNNDAFAFSDIKKETNLMLYADDFYDELIMIYQVRSGA